MIPGQFLLSMLIQLILDNTYQIKYSCFLVKIGINPGLNSPWIPQSTKSPPFRASEVESGLLIRQSSPKPSSFLASPQLAYFFMTTRTPRQDSPWEWVPEPSLEDSSCVARHASPASPTTPKENRSRIPKPSHHHGHPCCHHHGHRMSTLFQAVDELLYLPKPLQLPSR